MTIRTAEGSYRRDGVPPSTGSASTLLVIGSSRGHVSKRDSREGADIYADLHSSGAREDIDRGPFATGISWPQVNILE